MHLRAPVFLSSIQMALKKFHYFIPRYNPTAKPSKEKQKHMR